MPTTSSTGSIPRSLSKSKSKVSAVLMKNCGAITGSLISVHFSYSRSSLYSPVEGEILFLRTEHPARRAYPVPVLSTAETGPTRRSVGMSGCASSRIGGPSTTMYVFVCNTFDLPPMGTNENTSVFLLLLFIQLNWVTTTRQSTRP